MRTIVPFTILLVALGLWGLRHISDVRLWTIRAGDFMRGAVYHPTVVIDGLEGEGQSLLEDFIPQGRSLLWWMWNSDRVEAELRTSSFFSTVRIERCDWYRLACYRLRLQRRSPAFVAFAAGQPWLVDQEGAFIQPVPRSRLSDLRMDGAFPFIEGASEQVESLEVIGARVKNVIRAVKEIRKESGFEVSQVKMTPDGELQIRFQNYSFVAVFGGIRSDLSPIASEVKRLKAVLQQFEGREGALREIDLAFKRTAVVRLHGDSESRVDGPYNS